MIVRRIRPVTGRIRLTIMGLLQPFFDFAVKEQCRQYKQRGRYRPFLRAGKAIFNAEYDLTSSQFCLRARSLGLSSIRKTLKLGVWRLAC
jgi:hypothetical protein